MELVTIGCGHAGGKIVDTLLERQDSSRTAVAHPPLAVNTSRADLEGLNHIADRCQILIGEETVNGEGIGADNELGVRLTEEHRTAITDALQTLHPDATDGILIIAGLGGGAGSGGAPVLAAHLAEHRPEPVYGVGILPHRSEGSMYMLNAARSLQTLRRETDAVIGFDNDAWYEAGNTGQKSYRQLNDKLADRLLGLFPGSQSERDGLPEIPSARIQDVLDSADMVSIGVASESISARAPTGAVRRLRELLGRTSRDAPAVTELIKAAVQTRMTLPCKMTDASDGLVVVTGPPALIDQDELNAGQSWLASKIAGSVEVGVNPDPQAQELLATVALTGLSDVARVQTLKQEATRAQRSIGTLKQGNTETETDIQPLF